MSSEIAQSRERFEKLAKTADWAIGTTFDYDTLYGCYGTVQAQTLYEVFLAAERDTRERVAQIAKDRAEILRNTKCQAETSERNFHILDACQGELLNAAERIRGKE